MVLLLEGLKYIFLTQRETQSMFFYISVLNIIPTVTQYSRLFINFLYLYLHLKVEGGKKDEISCNPDFLHSRDADTGDVH